MMESRQDSSVWPWAKDAGLRSKEIPRTLMKMGWTGKPFLCPACSVETLCKPSAAALPAPLHDSLVIPPEKRIYLLCSAKAAIITSQERAFFMNTLKEWMAVTRGEQSPAVEAKDDVEISYKQ